MRRWYKSFHHAVLGLKTVFKTEKSFRFHVLIAVAVLIAAGLFKLDELRLIIIFLTIALVLALEIVNSAVERLVDMLAPKTHSFAKEVKDLMAAVVLVASIFALLIGLLIFVIR